MILKVATDGLLIPRDYLDGADAVELRREDGRLVVTPLPPAEADRGDEGIEPRGRAKIGSIYDRLGKNPIECGLPDASVRLDEYVYGDPHGDKPR